MVFSVLFTYFVIFCLTCAYAIVLWFASGIWSLIVKESGEMALPLISQITIAPLPLPLWWTMIHWQAFAFLSLLVCFIWGCSRNKIIRNGQGHVLPMIGHIAWLLLAILLHILGILSPILSIGHVVQ